MIIDFRLRPPVGDCRFSQLFANPDGMEAKAQARGMKHADSLRTLEVNDTLDEMRVAGVSKGVFPARIGNAAMGDIQNADVESAVKAYPDSFVGFASLGQSDLKAPATTVEELKSGGLFRGISLEPGTWPWPWHADDRRIYPLYEACERAKYPVMITGGTAGPDPTYTSAIYLDHIAADFPALPIIASHGAWPWVDLVLHVAYRRQNLYLLPDCYLFGMSGWRDYVDAANGFLQDRFLYGSAYPILPIGPCVARFKEMFPDEKIRTKLFAENASRLLGL